MNIRKSIWKFVKALFGLSVGAVALAVVYMFIGVIVALACIKCKGFAMYSVGVVALLLNALQLYSIYSLIIR
ncbi:hypothetical protein [Elizabethkingia phage TCUEAP1]|nr:hypothetical protein [Elizabethkingia phage TCUEAP1]